MNEDFIAWIWKHKNFDKIDLKTIDGEALSIIQPGIQNHDSGPDFSNARIKIGETLWAGNVEIHVKTSDWFLHQHEKDPMFKNVILHVVYEHDRALENNIPVFCIKDYFKVSLFKDYKNLISDHHPIACHNSIKDVEDIILNSWLERVEIERLNEKSIVIEKLLVENKNDWAETFYQILLSNFGFKVNALPFEMLSRSLPFKIILKYRHDLKLLEALFFGQAGFLNKIDEQDDYQVLLKKEFDFLKHKHQLQPIDNYLWKFLRIRPNGFPTIRLAQVAMLFYKEANLFSKAINTINIKTLQDLFKVETSNYWKEHYRFGDEKHVKKSKNLGKNSINLIILNTLVPIIFVYGKKNDEEKRIENAIDLLHNLPPEKNKIVTIWSDLNLKITSAFDSQAFLQLKRNYCDKRKCLECKIGNNLLNL